MFFSKRLVLAAAVFVPVLCHASIISITSGDTVLGNHTGNLIANGSFEADQGFALNGSFWATGTSLTPAMTLTSWQASGQVGTYASWGNNGAGRIRGSELIPDGLDALYFGGGLMAGISQTPIYQANGTVTFSSTPTFFPKPTSAPVTLTQTVSGLNTSQHYLLDFWSSAEDASNSTFAMDGIFGLDITGETQMYFACPAGINALGASQRYYVVFQPTASSVTFTWTNWGHYFGTGPATELVLDDVILNPTAVPEPATMLALGMGALTLARRRRRS